MAEYIIEIPRLPSEELSPNARVYYHEKNKHMALDKSDLIAYFDKKYRRPSKLLTSVKIELMFVVDKRRRDWDNLAARSKGFLDGLVKLVIVDDNTDIVKELVLKKREKKKGDTPWTIITISET